MSTSLMCIYRTAKLDMAEDFRLEFSQFMSLMRRNIAEEIQKRGEGYKVGNPPPVLAHIQAHF